MNKDEKKLLTLLASMTFITTLAVAHSVDVHLKERKKRKLIDVAADALREMKQTRAWKDANPSERKRMLDAFTDKYIYEGRKFD